MWIKNILLNLFYPKGKTAIILFGFLKGKKLFISNNSGWGPIFGRYEKASQDIFSQIIKPHMIVYDIGANNGLHSMMFSFLSNRVYAFEPLEENCREMEINFTINKIKNISIIKAAVSDVNDNTVFHVHSHNKQGSLFGAAGKKDILVETITLDSFNFKNKLNPDFIKIDVEGAEYNVLNGFKETIKINYPILYMELHSDELQGKVMQFLLEHGYLGYRLNSLNPEKNALNIKGIRQIRDLSKPYDKADGEWLNILAVHPKFQQS